MPAAQDDYDEEDDDDEASARRLQDGDEEGDARLARRLKAARRVNDGGRPRGLWRRRPPPRKTPVDGRGRPGLAARCSSRLGPTIRSGGRRRVERALAASRAEAGLAATERWDAPGPASPGGADDDDVKQQAALLGERGRPGSPRRSARSPGHPAVGAGSRARGGPMTDAAATGRRRLNRRRSSDSTGQIAAWLAQDGQPARAITCHPGGLPPGRPSGAVSQAERDLGLALLLLGDRASPSRRRHRGRVSFVYNPAVSDAAEPRALHLAGLAAVSPPVVHAAGRRPRARRPRYLLNGPCRCVPALWTTFSAQGVGHSPVPEGCTTRGGCFGVSLNHRSDPDVLEARVPGAIRRPHQPFHLTRPIGSAWRAVRQRPRHDLHLVLVLRPPN